VLAPIPSDFRMPGLTRYPRFGGPTRIPYWSKIDVMPGLCRAMGERASRSPFG